MKQKQGTGRYLYLHVEKRQYKTLTESYVNVFFMSNINFHFNPHLMILQECIGLSQTNIK